MKIIVIVEGGCVQSVFSPTGTEIEVEVRDYDTDGTDSRLLRTDKDGQQYDELHF